MGYELNTSLSERKYVRIALLVCGILSSLLYVAINIIVPVQWKSYNWVSQTVSELSAINAPTRPLWVLLCIPYTVLVIAFGWGVWISARKNRILRVVGGLMLAYGILGIAWPFTPMHLRGTVAGMPLTDIMHIVLGGVTVLLFLLAIGFGAAAFGKRFRIYSITTMLIVIASGILTGMESPGIAANLPTPLIGVWERISIGVFLLWVVVLAIVLLRERTGSNPSF